MNQDSVNKPLRLVAFLGKACAMSQQFMQDILQGWQAAIPIDTVFTIDGLSTLDLAMPVSDTPTIILIMGANQEMARYTGYDGQKQHFWQWLGRYILTPDQQKIAFAHGTERPFCGLHLHEKRSGRFVDPITGETLFLSDTKFESGSGWPSFFAPVAGALTFHEDFSFGMKRVEVKSASSGIHLGHVFDDGPPPTHKRYCINGNVLRFIPDIVEES